jgi:AI-2 transport protein TqsA
MRPSAGTLPGGQRDPTQGEPPPARPPSERDFQTVCLLILALFAGAVGLYLLRPLLVPFVLAVFFTYCLTPIIDLQTRRWGMPHGLAILGAGVVGVLAIALIGCIVTLSITQVADRFGDYQDQLVKLTREMAEKLPLDKLGIDVRKGPAAMITLDEADRRHLLGMLLSEMTELVSRGGVVLMFMIFILLGRKQTRVPSTGLLPEIEARVKHFVTRIVFFSALTGFLVWLTLLVSGLSNGMALMFGFLAFLLNFIPSVGSVVATLLPLPVILLSPDLSVAQKVLALVLPACAQGAIAIVQPKYVGDSLGLHPIAVVMALIFFGMIWGLVGAFLAAPMMAVIKIILERNPTTRPIADVLGGDLGTLRVPGVVDAAPAGDRDRIATDQ